MTAALTTTDRRTNVNNPIRQQPATTTKPAAKTDAKKPTTTTTGDRPAPGLPSSGPTATPTLETSLAARRARGADPTTNQLRARLEGSLPDGDAPNGSRNLGAFRGNAALRGLNGRTSTNPATTKPTNAPGTTTDPGATSDDPMAAKKAGDESLLGRGAEFLKNLWPFGQKPEGFSENDDGSYTFNGAGGDDNYAVTQANDGAVTVKNEESGETWELTAEQAANGVTINAGDGDDHVNISTVPSEPGKDLGRLTVDGGDGDDHVSARGSRGPVEIKGGDGDDHLTGGDGMDALAGGDGDDHLVGGGGNDQLLAQDGNDHVDGGTGDDMIMGGDGRDRLGGGRGGDAIYGDKGDYSIDAGKDNDNDVVVSEEGSVAAQNIGANDVNAQYDKEATEEYLADHPELVIDGSEDFVARTQADIGVMLSTEQGRGLLDDLTGALQDQGEELRFEEKIGEAGGTYSDGVITTGMWAETYDDGSNRVPLPVTFHEMVHAYQDFVSGFPEGQTRFENGATTNNLELQTVGLPWIDKDGNLHEADELPYTDNQFRRELGLPERSEYGAESGAPTEYAEDGGGHTHEHGH